MRFASSGSWKEVMLDYEAGLGAEGIEQALGGAFVLGYEESLVFVLRV